MRRAQVYRGAWDCWYVTLWTERVPSVETYRFEQHADALAWAVRMVGL